MSTNLENAVAVTVVASQMRHRQRAEPRRMVLSDAKAMELAKAGIAGVTHDTRVPGLSIRISASGGASWLWRRFVNGRAQQQVLGKVGAIKAEDARRAAQVLNGTVALGRDPRSEAAARRQAKQTLQDAFKVYLHSGLRPATVKAYQAYWKHVGDIAERPLPSITPDELKALHIRLCKSPGPTTANRLLAVISAIMGREGRRGSNPAREVKRAREQVRTRRLSSVQLSSLRDVLRQHRGDVWADYFALMVATGARRSTLSAMRWDQVDLARGIWTVPSTMAKNKIETGIALTAGAVEILQARRKDVRDEQQWVFPSDKRRNGSASATGHVVSPEKPLLRFLALAGLPSDVTCHDLRRSVGSLLAARGANAAIIAGALGHKSLASAKAYLHLDVGEVRDFLEKL